MTRTCSMEKSCVVHEEPPMMAPFSLECVINDQRFLETIQENS